MTIKTITSPQNQRVKDSVKLRDHRQRAKQGRFVIDGAREILQALRAGLPLTELFICEPLCKSVESQQVLARLDTLEGTHWQVTPEVFEKLAFGSRSDGIVAVGTTLHRALADLSVPPGSLVAVLEGLEKPGNVGAVLRSADAAGVAAVIIAEGRTDLFNPNCIRASLGAVFTKPVCEATSQQVLTWLRERQAKIFAARLDAAQSYDSVDYRGDAAIVVGSEAEGLSKIWQADGILPVKLPMLGAVDSLNVSATAAVLFYEALRQRTNGRSMR